MRLISLISIDSTNTHAQRLIRDGLTEDSLIYSEEQTKGRGQRGNNWLSRPGDGVYCSYVFFHKDLPIVNQFVFNMAMAVAVAAFVESKIQGSIQVKWPNDILVNQKKIAGLLIENTIKGEKVGVSIVGVGLNLNQEWKEQNFETPVTSIKAEAGIYTEYEIAVFELAKYIKRSKEQFDKGEFELIIKNYHQYLYKNQEVAEFIIENEIVEAKLEGVNADGTATILLNQEVVKVNHPQARMKVTHS
ncbi:MAG: biotin--[acetyl-CoA-carboxylase] ligase [Bacteroidota bacterium]